MLSKNELSKQSKKISSEIKTTECILFIGKKADEDESLISPLVTRMRWSGVITTCDNKNICDKFNNKDIRNDVIVVDSINESSINRKDMPFFDLNRLAAISPDDDEDDIKYEKRNTFQAVLKKVLPLGSRFARFIYVIGYDDNEFNIRWFQRDICSKKIYFFGMTTETEDTKRFRERNYYRFFEEELDKFLPDDDENDGVDLSEPSDNNCYFYIDGKVYSLSDQNLQKTKKVLCLANRYDLEQSIPYGRELQKRYFREFLESDSDSPPQWYAFTRNTDFAIKRPFERGLQYIVEKALDGDTMPDGKKYDPQKPIILMGPPSSSKTTSLGALAYNIYRREKYPVLFVYGEIKNENKENLCKLMETINRLDPSCKILLICDFSSYTNSFLYAHELAKELYNLGRRFVLVVSTFEHKNNWGTKLKSYQWNNENKCFDEILNKSKNNTEDDIELLEKSDMSCSSDYWIVRSYREVSEKEILGIKKLFKDYGGIELPTEWWNTFKNEDRDIFEYFFALTDLVRNPMKKGLILEKSGFKDYHKKEIQRIYREKSQKSSGNIVIKKYNTETKKYMMESLTAEKLKEAFNIPSDGTSEKTKEIEVPNELMDKLQKFQDCIAMFSQYAIKTPYSLATAFFNQFFNQKDISSYYSTDDFELSLNRFLTKSIPWIHCNEIDGTLFFSFRNTREAIIHIEDTFSGINEGSERYVDFILEIFDLYKNMQCMDYKIVIALSILLREIGPNGSKWNEIRQLHENYIQKNLNLIIDKIQEVIDAGVDYDKRLTLTMITFRREYYKKGNNGDIENNKREQQNTIHLCDKILDEIKIFGNTSLKCQIINEKTQCEISISEMTEDKEFFSSFDALFSDMESVVYSNPENGFYYNTIFRLFEDWNPKNESSKLPYYGRLAAIADQSELYDIVNVGANDTNELGKHIAKFHQNISGNFGKILIENLDNDDVREFKNRFEDANDRGDSSYIWLICYNELCQCSLMGKKSNDDSETDKSMINKINTYQQMICKKVFDFMKKYYDTVKKDLSTLRLMFRVYWLYNTSTEPQVFNVSQNECRFTKFNKDQWTVIFNICRDYVDLCKEKATIGALFMKYMYAFSRLNLSNIDEKNLKECYCFLQTLKSTSYIEKGEKRMFSQFVLCDEGGKPICFNGNVKEVKDDKNGIMQIKIGGKSYFECSAYCNNIGLRTMSDVKSKGGTREFKNLAIGIGYTRIQAYTLEIVNEKETKRRENND